MSATVINLADYKQRMRVGSELSIPAQGAETEEKKDDVTDCFIDTTRPLTPAERAAWSVYLALPTPIWRAARSMFRRSHVGAEPAANLRHFVSDTGVTDAAVLSELERVLLELAKEARR